MCTQCVVDPLYYGEFAPGWFLIRATKPDDDIMEVDDWGLVECNNPSIVFSTTPVVFDGFIKTFNRYIDFQEEFYMPPSVGYRLYDAMSKVKIPFRVKRKWVDHSVLSFEQRFFYYLADFIKNSIPVKESRSDD
jgi:hypothetical protein